MQARDIWDIDRLNVHYLEKNPRQPVEEYSPKELAAAFMLEEFRTELWWSTRDLLHVGEFFIDGSKYSVEKISREMKRSISTQQYHSVYIKQAHLIYETTLP